MGQSYDLAIMLPSSAFGTSPTIPIGNPATINGVTYLSFAAAGASSGTTISYSLLDPSNGGSEVGTAIYNSSTSLTSRTPTFSTNSSYINASSGCFIQSALRAEDAANLTTTNTFSQAATFSSNVTISGGLVVSSNIQGAGTTISGGGSYTGTLSAGSLISSGALTVSSNATIAGTLDSSGGIIGVTNGSNASAGIVGELVSSIILSSQAVAIPNSSVNNLTSLPLTAGDWDVWSIVQANPSGAMTAAAAGVSSQSQTRQTNIETIIQIHL